MKSFSHTDALTSTKCPFSCLFYDSKFKKQMFWHEVSVLHVSLIWTITEINYPQQCSTLTQTIKIPLYTIHKTTLPVTSGR